MRTIRNLGLSVFFLFGVFAFFTQDPDASPHVDIQKALDQRQQEAWEVLGTPSQIPTSCIPSHAGPPGATPACLQPIQATASVGPAGQLQVSVVNPTAFGVAGHLLLIEPPNGSGLDPIYGAVCANQGSGPAPVLFSPGERRCEVDASELSRLSGSLRQAKISMGVWYTEGAYESTFRFQLDVHVT